MIRVYANDCEDFENNGLGILIDFKTSPKIKESLNGCFELNFDYAVKGQNVEYLIVDNIIKVPYDNSEQLFRIKKIKPSLNKINIYATHIFYDLSDNFLIDVRPTNKSAVNAMQYLLDNAMYPTSFSVTGDVISDNTAFFIKKNIVEAILGADNCIVKRWGGEIERDNFNIIYHRERGKDRGVFIKHGKNIKEIELDIDFTTVATRIVPQGSNDLTLPEIYVDSPIINTYRTPIVKKIEFSDIAVDEETTEIQAQERLREAAMKQFEDGIDKPTISVKVDWLELSKMDEYKEKYSNFEYVRLGDTVTVQALGYEYKIRVITVEYDCLLKRYTSFEIGDPKADYVEKQTSAIEQQIQKTTPSLLEQARKAATVLINNGFGGHVRVYPDRILIMDTDDESTAKNVWQWNLNGFGFSSTGINGDYETAITIDGQIVADRITTGTMSVQRISGLANALNTITTQIELNESNIQLLVSETKKLDDTIKDVHNSIKQEITDTHNTITSEVSTKISKLQIGGTNLAQKGCIAVYSGNSPYATVDNTNFDTEGKSVFTRTANVNSGPIIDRYTIFEEGKNYVIHFKLKMITTENVSVKAISIYNVVGYTNTKIIIDGQELGEFNTNNTPYLFPNDENWHYVELRFTGKDNSEIASTTLAKDHLILQMNKLTNDAYTCYIDEFKIENGDYATAWSPCPVDMTTSEYTASIQQKVENDVASINMTVSSTTNKINDLQDSVKDQLDDMSKIVSQTQIDMRDNYIQLKKEVDAIDSTGAKVVTTKTGTFDDNGLTMDSNISDVKATLDVDGLEVEVKSTEEKVLQAIVDEHGNGVVNATNVTVKNYLNVPGDGRFENYNDSQYKVDGPAFFLQ